MGKKKIKRSLRIFCKFITKNARWICVSSRWWKTVYSRRFLLSAPSGKWYPSSCLIAADGSRFVTFYDQYFARACQRLSANLPLLPSIDRRAIPAYAVSDLPPSRYLGHLGDEYEMVDFWYVKSSCWISCSVVLQSRTCSINFALCFFVWASVRLVNVVVLG